MTETKSCRVLIADDHTIVRNAVRPLLESIAGVTVVGEAENGIVAIALAKKLQPDLLVLDVTMPHAGGITVIGEVHRFSPQTRVIVLTGSSSARALSELRASGAMGILLKSCSPEELIRGFRAVIADRQFIAEQAQLALATNTAIDGLTMRERQVLSLVTAGKSNTEIAALLNISHKTVDNHRTRLMQKLDVHSAAELTAIAIREGLTDSL